MQFYEEITKTSRELKEIRCDLCGEVMRDPPEVDNEVNISHTITRSSHGGGHGASLHTDICGECFTDKVLPMLRTLGLKREYEEFDF